MTTEENLLRNELVALWRADLGQREDQGANRSVMIDAINKRLGVPMGSPYCIGGVLVRGVEQLCKKHNLKNPVTMVAGTQDFWFSAKKLAPSCIYEKGARALKGDICILVNRQDHSHGHAYGLTEDEGAKQMTIEYNTNLAGSRNGDGVYELTRTQDGTATKEYRGAVDVVHWILSVNPEFRAA
jgi:hypothetical protein